MMKSGSVINEILKDVEQKGAEYILKNRLDYSDNSLQNWKKNANFAKKTLEENDIDYCLIKGYDIPHAIMDDVDILIENDEVFEETFSKLKERWVFFQTYSI